MSAVPASRASEAGGVQGASQNLGQSLGTALIGAVLLTGLTSGFQDRVQADPSVPAALQRRIAEGTQQGLPMVSQAQFESAVQDAGVPARQVDTLVELYNDAQIDALKRALLVASLFSFVGLWFARALPGERLAPAAASEVAVPPRPRAVPA
jgi:hypothetical protein